MEKIKILINKIINSLSRKGINDVRFLGLLLLAFIGISVMWNGTRVVQQNYELLKKIAILQDENRILELQNSNKQIQNDYYKTPEFAELKVRRVNGKASPGETVYIVTNETALSSLKTPEEVEFTEQSIYDKPRYQQNFEAWMEFFFNKD